MIKLKFDIGLLFLIMALLLSSVFLFYPLNFLTPVASKAAGLAIMTIALFATGKIPEYLTVLIFFLMAMLFNIASAPVVFSGFHSTALWLVFGGLVIGVGITATGLGQRMAKHLAAHLEGTYIKLITGITVAGVLFSFIMPSAMGRMIILVPISIALAEHFGFKKGSNGRTGLLLATALGCLMPAFSILPANVVNMVLVGMAESQLNISPLYGEYFLLHFPFLGLAKTLLIIVVIVWLYPDQPVICVNEDIDEHSPMSTQEKILSAVLILLLLLWTTDFLHHISPAWVALAGAIFLLLPAVGIVSTQSFNTKVNHSSVFFVAGVIGLGSLIKDSGLGLVVGEALISVLPLNPETSFINYMLIALTSTVTGVFTTLPGVPAVMTPLATEIAGATGLSVKSVLMLQVLGFSNVLFPYQAPPIIVALHLAGEKTRSIIKPMLFIAFVGYCIFLPLNYIWWAFLGWI